MKSSRLSIALALALAVSAVGCSDPQEAAPATTAAPVAVEPADVTPAADATTDAATLSVVLWGPKSTPVGTAFNVQADGQSAMFVELSGDAPLGKLEATFDGRPLIDVVANGRVVTGTVPTEYLGTAGSYPIVLVVPEQDVRIPVGDFIVDDGTMAEPTDEADSASDTPPPSA